jgi:DNA polymerase III subunit epsilon
VKERDRRVQHAIQLSPQPSATRFAFAVGDLVVLTGEMRRPREEWFGIVKVDPDSLSGKARKARDYGIPVVDEAWLEATLVG